MHATQPQPVSHVKGFTLIEVMMAVLILGIGLLGLGALLPATVMQQRASADATFGVIGAQSAQTLFASQPFFADDKGDADKNWNQAIGDYWAVWAVALNSVIPDDGSWYAVPVGTAGTGTAKSYSASTIGQVVTNSGGTVIIRPLIIPLGERLCPPDSSGASDPQFVWDLAVRRLAPFDYSPAPGTTTSRTPSVDADRNTQPAEFAKVQIAVIVRRLDPRARVIDVEDNKRYPLYYWFARSDDTKRLLPVSISSTLQPWRDGRGDIGGTQAGIYATPITIPIKFDPDSTDNSNANVRDHLIFDSGNTAAFGLPAGVTSVQASVVFALLSQPGQTLIDNLGNVLTVAGVDRRTIQSPAGLVDGPYTLRLAKPIPANVTRATSTNHSYDATSIRQVVLTPQLPAAVQVFTVNP